MVLFLILDILEFWSNILNHAVILLDTCVCDKVGILINGALVIVCFPLFGHQLEGFFQSGLYGPCNCHSENADLSKLADCFTQQNSDEGS